MTNQSKQHKFAIFFDAIQLSHTQKHTTTTLKDPALVHRIQRVLRLSEGEAFILFDRSASTLATIQSISSREITLSLSDHQKTLALTPTITLGLPLLKRSHLEEACYNATEVGVNHIALLTTKKCLGTWKGEQEIARLTRIAIGAAEQSKNLKIPSIAPPAPLQAWLSQQSSKTARQLILNPSGTNLLAILQELSTNQPESITLLTGPEGDFTDEEMNLIQTAGFTPCALGPTILRSHQALSVAVGAIRSVI